MCAKTIKFPAGPIPIGEPANLHQSGIDFFDGSNDDFPVLLHLFESALEVTECPLCQRGIVSLYAQPLHPHDLTANLLFRVADVTISLGEPLKLSVRSEEHTSELQSRRELV